MKNILFSLFSWLNKNIIAIILILILLALINIGYNLTHLKIVVVYDAKTSNHAPYKYFREPSDNPL